MLSLLEIIRTEYATEYANKQTEVEKKYTEPKIYHGGKEYDLSKRWYVYYSFLNAETGKMERQPPIYDRVNRIYKTKKERMEAIKLLRKIVSRLLKKGYVPNTMAEQVEENLYSAETALDYALSVKKAMLAQTSYRDYENRLRAFKDFLQKKELLYSSIEYTTKKYVVEFLDSVLKKSSIRNRNNTRIILSSLFTVLEDNEMIDRNFIKNIKPLKDKPERNKTYSMTEVQKIYEYIETKDAQLLLFLKFVSYNFLRPIEVCRLQVKDINLEDRLLVVRAKNKAVKTKIIPQIIYDELIRLDLSNPNAFLFTSQGIAETEVTPTDRRDYFTKKYSKVKKALNLGRDFTIYSFRHTFITKLFRELRKQYSYTETCDKLRLVTGHSTQKALQQYLRDIDSELPEDYSDLLQ
ncbi:MAG: tyrosine-type recombinase/integrase [Flavobacteriaceae bacterium]|nr:tyrosine-type recombinase/integrase [Flavobacteriaceae bacterium]